MAMPILTGFAPTMTVNTNACTYRQEGHNLIWTVNATCTGNAVMDNALTAPWVNYNGAVTTNTVVTRRYQQVTTCVGDIAYFDLPCETTVRYTYTGDAATFNNAFRFIATTLGDAVLVPKTAGERLKEILEQRAAPRIISSCKPLGFSQDEREMRARETLRRVLGEQKFRDFVRRGSISVRAKSGMIYQIFPGHDFTKVYDSGKLVDRLCVVLQGNFPPTDSLIMRYLMILNNEQQFRSYAIKHGVNTPTLPVTPDQRSLVEIFKELKKAA